MGILRDAYSFFQTLRASWHFGGGSKAGDQRVAMSSYANALRLLARPGVDPDFFPCRAMLPLALKGYFESAKHCAESPDPTLVIRWRPHLDAWGQKPVS